MTWIIYILFWKNRAVDQHVTTREQITLQDPMEENIYFGSQFGLDGTDRLFKNLFCNQWIKFLNSSVKAEYWRERPFAILSSFFLQSSRLEVRQGILMLDIWVCDLCSTDACVLEPAHKAVCSLTIIRGEKGKHMTAVFTLECSWFWFPCCRVQRDYPKLICHGWGLILKRLVSLPFQITQIFQSKELNE